MGPEEKSKREKNSEEKLQDNLKAILNSARQFLKTEMAHVAVFEEATGNLHMKVCLGAKTQAFHRLIIPGGIGMGAKALEANKPLRCKNFLLDYKREIPEPMLRICKAERLMSGIAVPLTIGKERLGVLWVFNRSFSHFNDSDEQYLLVLGSYAALQVATWRRERDDERQKTLLRNLTNLHNSIVDEKLTEQKICGRVLEHLIDRFELQSAAWFDLEEGRGVFVGRSYEKNQCSFEVEKPLDILDLGQPEEIWEVVLGSLNKGLARSYFEKSAGIFNGFKDQPYSPFRRSASLFGSARNVMIVPVQVQTSSSAPESGFCSRGSASNVLSRKGEQEGITGFFLFLDKTDGTDFSEADSLRVKELPLSAIMVNAKQMPFRVFEKTATMWAALKLFRVRRIWQVRETILRVVMHFLKIVMVVFTAWIVVDCAVTVGFGLVIDRVNQGSPGGAPIKNLAADLLRRVELAVTGLTFTILGVGVITLVEPRYAKGLPPWIMRFTDILALKSTILTLVVILVSIAVLTRFVQDSFSTRELLDLSAAACLLIVAIALFVKLNLGGQKTS